MPGTITTAGFGRRVGVKEGMGCMAFWFFIERGSYLVSCLFLMMVERRLSELMVDSMKSLYLAIHRLESWIRHPTVRPHYIILGRSRIYAYSCLRSHPCSSVMAVRSRRIDHSAWVPNVFEACFANPLGHDSVYLVSICCGREEISIRDDCWKKCILHVRAMVRGVGDECIKRQA